VQVKGVTPMQIFIFEISAANVTSAIVGMSFPLVREAAASRPLTGTPLPNLSKKARNHNSRHMMCMTLHQVIIMNLICLFILIFILINMSCYF
jgi:hypothetical protein